MIVVEVEMGTHDEMIVQVDSIGEDDDDIGMHQQQSLELLISLDAQMEEL